MIGAALGLALLLEWPFSVRVEPFSGLSAEGKAIGCMRMTSASTLYPSRGGFGGYSDLHLDQETGILTMLSDSGHLFRSQATFNDQLAITALGPSKYFKIGVHGVAPKLMDTEAMVPVGDQWLITRERRDDAILVTFDEQAEEVRYDATLTELVAPIEIPNNQGFEAASAIGEGRFLFIPEARESDLAPIMLYQDGQLTHIADYSILDGFAVTDIEVDLAADRLFILERFFSRRTGPKARIKLLALSGVLASDGDPLRPKELGRMGILDGIDNMEGLHFAKAPDGSDNLILVSDDNYSDIQRTVLMTLRLEPSCF